MNNEELLKYFPLIYEENMKKRQRFIFSLFWFRNLIVHAWLLVQPQLFNLPLMDVVTLSPCHLATLSLCHRFTGSHDLSQLNLWTTLLAYYVFGS